MQNLVKELVNKMGFDCRVEAGDVFCNIQVNNPALLIGPNGNNIHALQHLAKLIVIKNKKIIPEFTLDINNYRQQKIDSLRQLAKSSAYRAIALKKEIALKPMSAYDRRIIHIELAENKNIITESQGQEPERRVIIRSV